MVACCQLKTAEFFDPRISLALETAQQCADDPSVEAIANAVWEKLATLSRLHLPSTGPEAEVVRALNDVWQLLDEVWVRQWDGENYGDAQHAIAHAVFMCLRDKPGVVFTGGEGDAVEYCTRAIGIAASLRLGADQRDAWASESDIQMAIASLLRDIFGNPFRPVAFNPSWRSATALDLARGMYESRDFGPMPILADALEDAGCDSDDILAHCRGDGPHVRGCWVVDLVLGKA
jgi:hypothetical protein